MEGTILILGATSSVARSAAAAFAAEGRPLLLAARDREELRRIAADLTVRFGGPVSTLFFDAEAISGHGRFFEDAVDLADGAIAGVVMAFGDLGDNGAAALDFSYAEPIIMRNYTGACSILTHAANYLEKRKGGFIVGIGSVAGDRGRQSNYTYGSAKGALALYLSGLRNRLYPAGVRVATVKFGFIDTAMTFGLPLPFSAAAPGGAGKAVVKAASGGRDILYYPWFWRWIMAVIKAIPESLFKRLKL